MAKSRSKSARRPRSFRRSRRAVHRPTHGIIPVELGGIAAAIPFFDTSETGESAVTHIMTALDGNADQWNYVLPALKGGVWNNLGEIVGLGAAAAGFAWAGRKFGLGKATAITKKWSVFGG